MVSVILSIWWCGTGAMPTPEEIQQSGLRSGKARERDSDEIWLRDTVGNLVGPGERRPKEVRRSEFVQMGEGLLPMSRRLVDKIQAGEFVEFAEFPVLDGGGARSMDQADQDDRRWSKREVPCASSGEAASFYMRGPCSWWSRIGVRSLVRIGK